MATMASAAAFAVAEGSPIGMSEAQPPPPHEVTRLLEAAAGGDRASSDRLFALVYDELRAVAAGVFRTQGPGHTLQPTALVHDVYVRLAQTPGAAWKDRAHFYATAARAMRQVLTDHARRRGAAKRGGGRRRVALDDDVAITTDRSLDLVALDEALTRLGALDERRAHVVELRFFGGFTTEQAADFLDVSRDTVVDDWTVARAWLRAEVMGAPASDT